MFPQVIFFLYRFFSSLLHTMLPKKKQNRTCQRNAPPFHRMHLGLCIRRPSSDGHVLRVALAHYCWKVVMYLTSYSIIRRHSWLSGDFRLTLSHWPAGRPSVHQCPAVHLVHSCMKQLYRNICFPLFFKRRRKKCC